MADDTKTVEFERGDKVKHSKWGIGTILYKSGSGDRSKVIVLFQEVGQKTLMVKFAKLEKVASSPIKVKNMPYLEEVEEEPEEEVEEAEETEEVPEVAEEEETL